MDITAKPNLKPLRDYDEHEVINLYAHSSAADVNKGTFVTATVADGNTNVSQNGNSPATPHSDTHGSLSNLPSRATALRHEVSWKIDTAASGDTVLGVMLYDVKENNVFGEPFIYKPSHERAEQSVTISGEATPVLTRGLIKTNGFNGAPGPNSGAVVWNATGFLDLNNDLTTAILKEKVGKFLSTPDADGYALFKVEL
jgi:hypothetical protein